MTNALQDGEWAPRPPVEIAHTVFDRRLTPLPDHVVRRPENLAGQRDPLGMSAEQD
jgi:hypothetical protein